MALLVATQTVRFNIADIADLLKQIPIEEFHHILDLTEYDIEQLYQIQTQITTLINKKRKMYKIHFREERSITFTEEHLPKEVRELLEELIEQQGLTLQDALKVVFSTYSLEDTIDQLTMRNDEEYSSNTVEWDWEMYDLILDKCKEV